MSSTSAALPTATSSNSTILSTSTVLNCDPLVLGNLCPIGPPGWSQLISITDGSPYNIPQPFIISVGLWIGACIGITIWAATVTRRSRNQGNPITLHFFNGPYYRYWITMTFALLSFIWWLSEDVYVFVNEFAQQRLFLTQFVFDFIGNVAQTCLLLNIYDLLFHLMRCAPLGRNRMSRIHFWRYRGVKKTVFGVLLLLAFLKMCLEIAYLSKHVFHPYIEIDGSEPDPQVFMFGAFILSWLAAFVWFFAVLEVLIVSGILLSQQRHNKAASGSQAIYVYNLTLITMPLFVATIFDVVCSFLTGPAVSDSDLATPFRNLLTVRSVFDGLGMILPLAGLVVVAKRADASMERRVNQGLDSMDMVLVDSDPEQTLARPTSSIYSGPRSWGGSTLGRE